MGGRCGSLTEGQQHLWAQNDCYYSFLLLLLLSKPMSRPGTVHEAHRKAAKAKKRAWHKEGASSRKRKRERATASYSYNVVCKNLCFVCLFVYAVLCELFPHTQHRHTPGHLPAHTFAYIAVAHANLYTCPDATINIRRKISHFSAFCLPAFIFAGLSRVAIITARSPVIYTKCISFIATANPQSKAK